VLALVLPERRAFARHPVLRLTDYAGVGSSVAPTPHHHRRNELREKYARLRREAALAEVELDEAQKRNDAAWQAVAEARNEYNRCDQALIEEMSSTK
jgi:hypothetical protein